jgi:hypothetical protein
VLPPLSANKKGSDSEMADYTKRVIALTLKEITVGLLTESITAL